MFRFINYTQQVSFLAVAYLLNLWCWQAEYFKLDADKYIGSFMVYKFKDLFKEVLLYSEVIKNICPYPFLKMFTFPHVGLQSLEFNLGLIFVLVLERRDYTEKQTTPRFRSLTPHLCPVYIPTGDVRGSAHHSPSGALQVGGGLSRQGIPDR